MKTAMLVGGMAFLMALSALGGTATASPIVDECLQGNTVCYCVSGTVSSSCRDDLTNQHDCRVGVGANPDSEFGFGCGQIILPLT